MLAVGALYTPQAAGSAALIVPAEKARWHCGLYLSLDGRWPWQSACPLCDFHRQRFMGWAPAYGGIGITACLQFSAFLAWRPARRIDWCAGGPQTWGEPRANAVVALLLITICKPRDSCVFTYMAPLLRAVDPCRSRRRIGLVFCDLWRVFVHRQHHCFAVWSIPGAAPDIAAFYGLLADRRRHLGAWRGPIRDHGGRVAVWGLGFASSNSMQQGRPDRAAPALGTAVGVAQHLSLYIEQAIGSASGGILFARDMLHGAGYVRWSSSRWRDGGDVDETSPGRRHPHHSRRLDCCRVLPGLGNSDPDQANRLDSKSALPYMTAENQNDVRRDMRQYGARPGPVFGRSRCARQPADRRGKPLVQVKPHDVAAKSKPTSIAGKLQACSKSTTEQRGAWNCYDGVFPPKPNPKAPAAKASPTAVSPKKKTTRADHGFNGFAEKYPNSRGRQTDSTLAAARPRRQSPDPRQHRLEDDPGQFAARCLRSRPCPVLESPQRQRDHYRFRTAA